MTSKKAAILKTAQDSTDFQQPVSANDNDGSGGSNDNYVLNQEARIHDTLFDPEKIRSMCCESLSSLEADKRLLGASIKVFSARIRACVKRSIIPEVQGKKIQNSLIRVNKEIIAGNVGFATEHGVKNLYDAIRFMVHQEIGALAQGLDVAYSRTEHEVTVLRLWLRDALETVDRSIRDLQQSLLAKAEVNLKVIMPSYLHGQTAQPVSLAHYMVAYAESLARDRARLENVKSRTNKSPIGACFGAGSSFEISRKMLARTLGFDGVMINALDAIHDRDFIAEFMSFAALCATHISKIVIDFIGWQHPQANFINIASQFLTSDPITQESRYPEILEHILMQSNILQGNISTTFNVLQNRPSLQDLQTLARLTVTTYDSLIRCLKLLTAIVGSFTINKKSMKKHAQSPYGLAPDIQHWLLQNTSLTHDAANRVTREIVALAVKRNKKLSLLELGDLEKICPEISSDIYSSLVTTRAIISRRTDGATSPVRARKRSSELRRQNFS